MDSNVTINEDIEKLRRKVNKTGWLIWQTAFICLKSLLQNTGTIVVKQAILF